LHKAHQVCFFVFVFFL